METATYINLYNVAYLDGITGADKVFVPLTVIIKEYFAE